MKKELAAVALSAICVCSAMSAGCKTNDAIILKNVTQAKNVILLIGDGMGPEQIKAGEIVKGESLTMQNFPYKTKVSTSSRNNQITDSAAAATALATGTRTLNGVVGKDESYNDLETIVDIAYGLGKSTGVLATEELYGATPMGFSGHAYTRGDSRTLLESAANSSNVNLFASSTISREYQNIFVDAGYTNLETADEISECTAEKVFGSYQIPASYDSMTADGMVVAFDRLVTEALEYLSKDEDGFFLMAEGSHIDHGGHDNNMEYMLAELLAFDDAVKAALEWAKDRDDTVVIVTADHETGGLWVDEDATKKNFYDRHNPLGIMYVPKYYSWSTGGHTATNVNLYINGANIDFEKYFFDENERVKNTDVFKIMQSLLTGKDVQIKG